MAKSNKGSKKLKVDGKLFQKTIAFGNRSVKLIHSSPKQYKRNPKHKGHQNESEE
jgi:hypothetical protein